MKLKEKILARKLRSEGLSLNEIIIKTGFAKGSVSVWVRDIELSKEQKTRLSEKGFNRKAIEQRRKNRIKVFIYIPSQK